MKDEKIEKYRTFDLVKNEIKKMSSRQNGWISMADALNFVEQCQQVAIDLDFDVEAVDPIEAIPRLRETYHKHLGYLTADQLSLLRANINIASSKLADDLIYNGPILNNSKAIYSSLKVDEKEAKAKAFTRIYDDLRKPKKDAKGKETTMAHSPASNIAKVQVEMDKEYIAAQKATIAQENVFEDNDKLYWGYDKVLKTANNLTHTMKTNS